MAATIAANTDMIAISNAGATIPVMSSFLSHEMSINVAMPSTVNALSKIPQYFIALKKCIAPGSIAASLSAVLAGDDRPEDHVRYAEAQAHH